MADNIALNKYATASNSVFPFIPAKAVDGVESYLARWLGSLNESTPNNWLSVDLGDLYWVDRWVVKHMGTLGWSSNYNLNSYKLQGSVDNTNWVDLDSVSGNTDKVTDRSFRAAKVRWARIYITSGLRCNPNFASIGSFELYAASPTDSKLSSMVLSNSIALNPEFNPTVNTYDANAKYDDSSIMITSTVADPRATLKVNGSPAVSGMPSGLIDLNAGVNNAIPVEVTPYIGDTNTYTVNVVRATSPYLSSLSIKIGMATEVPLNPVFSKEELSYTAEVPAGTSSARVTAVVEESSAILKINNKEAESNKAVAVPINEGSNTISIDVTSGTGKDSKGYSILVSRP